MSDPVSDRLFVDDAMVSLLAAEAHVVSLIADVLVRDEMISILLTTVHSQTQQIERLMFRLKHTTERPRG